MSSRRARIMAHGDVCLWRREKPQSHEKSNMEEEGKDSRYIAERGAAALRGQHDNYRVRSITRRTTAYEKGEDRGKAGTTDKERLKETGIMTGPFLLCLLLVEKPYSILSVFSRSQTHGLQISERQTNTRGVWGLGYPLAWR